MRKRRFTAVRLATGALVLAVLAGAFYAAFERVYTGPIAPKTLPTPGAPYRSIAPVTPVPASAPTPRPTAEPTRAAETWPLRGVSIGNALDAPREGDWGVVIQDGDFDLLARAGFTCVRIPVDFASNTGAAPDYALDEELLARVAHLAGAGARENQVVIIAYHSYEPLLTQSARQKYLAVWRQIAVASASWPDNVWLEIHHGPNGLSGARWQALAEDALSLVRAQSAVRTVVVPGVGGDARALPALAPDPHVVGGFAYFVPRAFTHQGERWSADTRDLTGVSWADTPGARAAIAADMRAAKAWSDETGMRVMITEFGATSRAESAMRAEWAAAVVEEANGAGLSACYWEFCGGFGVYDRAKEAFDARLLSALTP